MSRAYRMRKKPKGATVRTRSNVRRARRARRRATRNDPKNAVSVREMAGVAAVWFGLILFLVLFFTMAEPIG